MTGLPALSLLLTTLTRLTGLARLPLLAAAAVLPLSRLTIALAVGLRTGSSPEPRELVAQPRQIVHRPAKLRIFRRVLCAAQRASRLADLLAQLLEVASQPGFGRIGELGLAQPVGAARENWRDGVEARSTVSRRGCV